MRALRALEPKEGRKLPAIAITGYRHEHSPQAAREAGFRAYVTKPFDPTECCRIVARLAKGGE